MNERREIFAEMLPSFTSPSHQYHAIVKFRSAQSCCSSENPLFLETQQEMVLGEFLQIKDPIDMQYVATNQSGEKTVIPVQLQIVDVPRFQHFDKTRHEYYDCMKYFLYGDKDGAHMSHVISHSPDFFQVRIFLLNPY